MKTYIVKAKELVPQWHLVDAADQSLGRVAVRVASLLRGKHRPNFTPYLDMRDFVVVINAERIRITGKSKPRGKLYYSHSMYPGGFKQVTLEKMMSRHPTRVIEHAVRGMLPHNRLGAKLYRHLKVYVGPEHPHQAQLGGVKKEPAPPVAAVAQAEPAPVVEPVAVAEPVAAVAEAEPEEIAEPVATAVETEAEPAAEPLEAVENQAGPEVTPEPDQQEPSEEGASS
jgi:large subunit ribosomal protein L13